MFNTRPTYVKSNQLTNNYKQECLNFTEKNIRNIFKNYNNISFKFIKKTEGSFNLAVRSILNEYVLVKEEIKKGVLYLEDDWLVIKSKNLEYMFEYLNEDVLGISLYNNSKIGFKPTLWNLVHFNTIFIESFDKNTKIDVDPEQLVRDTNRYGIKSTDYRKYSKEIILTEDIHFIDIGIPWRNKRKLIKWDWSNCSTTYL